MSAKNAWHAFKNATEAGESTTYNTLGESMSVQIYGDASSVNVQVLGQVDGYSETWSVLQAINVSTLDMSTTLNKKGIYMLSIDGLATIKVKLVSVSGGSASVFCRTTGG